MKAELRNGFGVRSDTFILDRTTCGPTCGPTWEDRPVDIWAGRLADLLKVWRICFCVCVCVMPSPREDLVKTYSMTVHSQPGRMLTFIEKVHTRARANPNTNDVSVENEGECGA